MIDSLSERLPEVASELVEYLLSGLDVSVLDGGEARVQLGRVHFALEGLETALLSRLESGLNGQFIAVLGLYRGFLCSPLCCSWRSRWRRR
jgi:hypothetical protein